MVLIQVTNTNLKKFCSVIVERVLEFDIRVKCIHVVLFEVAAT